MHADDFYSRFELDERIANAVGFNPYYRVVQTGLDDIVLADGRKIIDLASNNYLGLANNPEVKKAACEAVKRYGASMCGTPIATGYTELYKRVECKLSQFTGFEASIILPSCYQANNGLFPIIAGKEDLVIVDRFAHSSLIQGIKASGCKIRPFLHNNVEHLNEILRRCSKYRQVFVVTESVFSTDGGIAPLKDIINVCEERGVIPVIDDSHGIGVIGKSGRGILEEQGIEDFQGIYTASLGKALANSGGVIAGRKGFINYLKYYCPHLVYSTAIPPASLGGIEKVLEIINERFDNISNRLWLYKELIYNALVDAGFEVCESKAPINSVMTGSAEKTLKLAAKLFESGIYSTPFIEPSVAINEGKVRLIAGANLSEETIEEATQIIKRAGKTA